jgi:hypothetical protein
MRFAGVLQGHNLLRAPRKRLTASMLDVATSVAATATEGCRNRSHFSCCRAARATNGSGGLPMPLMNLCLSRWHAHPVRLWLSRDSSVLPCRRRSEPHSKPLELQVPHWSYPVAIASAPVGVPNLCRLLLRSPPLPARGRRHRPWSYTCALSCCLISVYVCIHGR